MANKSVSLFEVLTPSSKSSAPSQLPKEDLNLKPAAPIQAPKETPRPTTISEKKQDSYSAKTASENHSVEGISLRKKDDHFGLIVTCLFLFSALTLIVGYSFGLHRGRNEVMTQWQSSSTPQPATVVTERKNVEVHDSNALPIPPVEVLPTSLRALSQDQSVAVAAPVAPKYFTLQVQTLGRNQKENIEDLVTKLKTAGFDSFADLSDGAIFVGRLENTRGTEVDQLKNALSRFNWRQRDFSSAYVRKIPSRLLEN